MFIQSASKVLMLAPLACLLVACSVDAEPDPQSTDPRSVVESAEGATPERTGTARSALQCCFWVYEFYQCLPEGSSGCPTPGPMPVPLAQ